jgi:predicted RNA-binding Zn ribbon-like protein
MSRKRAESARVVLKRKLTSEMSATRGVERMGSRNILELPFGRRSNLLLQYSRYGNLSSYFSGAKLFPMSATPSDEAPGRLDLLRVFVNTLDYPSGPDALESPEAASIWCRRHGLPPISNRRELDRLRGFREALREAFFANNGQGNPRAAWDALQPYFRQAHFTLTLELGCRPCLEPAGAGADRAISMMLALVYDAVAGGTWQRMRACRKSTCRFVYYDRSKNGLRAWCSMAVCGNREKAQRRRSRDRAL